MDTADRSTGDRRGTDRTRIATHSGVAAVVVVSLTILGATALYPDFSWTRDALSTTGAADAPIQSFLVFNGGLILTGLLGLPFAWRLFDHARNTVMHAGAVCFGLSLSLLGLVGVFYWPQPLHGLAAVGHYLGAILALWLYGSGLALAGSVRFGLATVWLGIGHLLVWFGWIATTADPLVGLAIPETVGALALILWVPVTARRLLADSSVGS